MARILILFATTDGQTAKIAGQVGTMLLNRGHAVTLRSVDEPEPLRDVEGHDAVIVGGGIRYGRYPKALESVVRSGLAAIKARPNAFFSVCLTAGGPGAKPDVARQYVADFRKRTRWQPDRTAIFAGALLYRQYNPFIRFMIRLIVGTAGGETDTSRDYEYTDWKAVERFAADYADELAELQPA